MQTTQSSLFLSFPLTDIIFKTLPCKREMMFSEVMPKGKRHGFHFNIRDEGGMGPTCAHVTEGRLSSEELNLRSAHTEMAGMSCFCCDCRPQ